MRQPMPEISLSFFPEMWYTVREFIAGGGDMPFRAHLHTVNRHRRMVRHYCFRLGLVWQGLTHDLSKYSPTESVITASVTS